MDNAANPGPEDAWSHNGNGSGNGTSPLDKAKEQINPMLQQAQQKAGEILGQAGDQVKSQLATQKEQASESLKSVAHVLRSAGDSLREEQYGSVGQYADSAAEQVEQIASFLNERDVDEIMHQVQEFARSKPALILGATFALGFFAARLLKNAETGGGAPSQDYTPSRYPEPAYSGAGYPGSNF